MHNNIVECLDCDLWRDNAYFMLHAEHKLCTTLAPHTCPLGFCTIPFLIPRIFLFTCTVGCHSCMYTVHVYPNELLHLPRLLNVFPHSCHHQIMSYRDNRRG